MKINKEKLIQTAFLAGATIFATVSPVLAVDNSKITITPPPGGIIDFSRLVTVGIRWAIAIAALLTLVFLIWGGIQWITSGGDKSAYEGARNRITAALVGLAIVAAAWAIMTLVGKFVGIDPFNLDLPSAAGNTGL